MKEILHLTTVHPGQDNRIFFKYLLGLQETGKYRLSFLCPGIGVPKSEDINISVLRTTGTSFISRIIRNIEAFLFCLKFKFKIIHFHDPEFLPFAIVLSLCGRTVIYDVHEDYIKAFELKKIITPFKACLVFLIRGMESYVDRYCHTVIAEKCYEYRFPNSIKVLNYFKDVDTSELYDDRYKFDTDNNLIYTGSISSERGAYEHVNLLECSSDINVYMIGKCTSELAEDLVRHAGKNSSRLHLVCDEVGINFNDILKYYHNNKWLFGLALFPFSNHYYEKELTKFFEYFYFDIAPLASDFPTWRALFAEAEFGYVLSHSSEFSDVLGMRVGSDKSFRKGHGFTWKSQLSNIMNLYDSI